MNNIEKKMVALLKDLKTHHGLYGVKAEFEAEGTRMEEALRLKEVVTKAGLDLSIKIGGCEAIKDMFDARTIGVEAIIAPMIESPYALKKYLQATKFVFPEEERIDIKFLANIETIYGFNHLEEMLQSEAGKEFGGVVFGRVDMSGSLGLTREEINSDTILDYAIKIAHLCLKYKKEMVIGGGVSADSLNFFSRLPEGALTRFETRKIIFDAPIALKANPADGLIKAVEFELMWLKNKREYYGMIYKEDSVRIEILEKRYKKLIDKIIIAE